MTTAEAPRTQGRAEGRAEGRIDGRIDGLVQVLTLKFGPLPQSSLDTIHAASIDQLITWNARVLTASTLEETLS
jgi:hypothetical protein